MDFRLFEEGDIKYLWAAYKKGSKSGILDEIPEDLTPDEFKDYLIELTVSNLDYAWTIYAPNKTELPVGFIYGKELFTSVVIGHMTWMPWASKRNVLEGVLSFINKMRKELHLIGTATFDDKKFFEHLCKYGVIRRSGTFNQCDPALTIFESRKVDE